MSTTAATPLTTADVVPPGSPMMLDLPRVASTLCVSESTVQKLVREGTFPPPRLQSGRKVGWLTVEVAAWAASRPVSNLLPPPNTGAPKPRQ